MKIFFKALSVSSSVFFCSFTSLVFFSLTQPVPHPLISSCHTAFVLPRVRQFIPSSSVSACIAVRLSSLAASPYVLLQCLLASYVSYFRFLSFHSFVLGFRCTLFKLSVATLLLVLVTHFCFF